MENLELYEKYRKPPKEALKPFDNGKFKGTDINTMWRIKCLTESFGMCGVGWYYTIKKLWTEEATSGDVFAFAEIELFIKADGEWSMPISGTGGNKLVRVTKDGKVSSSDEAYKMAVTDAFGVACRSLGLGADVYWENDRTKYTESAASVKMSTKEQIAHMLDLGVIVENVLKRFKIRGLSELTYEQAEFVIRAKERATENA